MISPAVEISGIQEEELIEPMAVKLSCAYVIITSQSLPIGVKVSHIPSYLRHSWYYWQSISHVPTLKLCHIC